MGMDERVVTAYHEAGHMLAYRLLGLPFRYATIRPRDPSCLGVVQVWAPRRIGGLESAQLAWAGLLAEARYSHSQDVEGLDLEDYEFGAYLVNRDGDTATLDGHAFGDVGQQLVRRWFDFLWPVVERYAALLLAESTVTGKRAWQVADEMGLPPPPLRRRR